ncbi:MAG: NAD(P)H-dependent oxidoreductase [Massilia sp.]
MEKRIVLIQGHPDPDRDHLCRALENAYAAGAVEAGHAVRHVDVASLEFPLLRSQEEWEHGQLPAALKTAQDDIGWAGHIVFFFPLWLGDMPAMLKGFLEQVARPGFAFSAGASTPLARKGLKGRSARVIVTMGMPSFVYRWYFRGHSIKSMKRNILGFVGIGPVGDTLIGMAGAMQTDTAARWLHKMETLGREGA